MLSIKAFLLKALLVFLISAVPITQSFASNICNKNLHDIAHINDKPSFSVRDFGATGNGTTDDTQAIQKAFDTVPAGSVLLFPKGTYLHNSSLTLAGTDIVILGDHSILQASNADDQALFIKGTRTSIVNMHLKGIGDKRSHHPKTAKIRLAGQWNQIINTTIDSGASAGIIVMGAQDFRIAGNTVRNTLADGIHMTDGARRGLVENNTVYHTGDDSIAVVSYTRQSNLSGDIVIRNNNASDVSYGRGITVVGGERVAIVGNTISDIKGCGGILISQEQPSRTSGVNHILVKDNIVNRIIIPEKANGIYTGHGAIDINSYNEYPVEYIDVSNNTVNDSRFAGVRLLGHVCYVNIKNNQFNKTSFYNNGITPIQVFKNTCAPQTITCNNNRSNNTPFSPNEKYCAPSKEAINEGPKVDYTLLENPAWQGCE